MADPLPPSLRSPRFQGPRFAKAYQNTPTIKKGEKGEHVRRLQQALLDLKMPLVEALKPHGTPHGRFDTELFEAVKLFQARELPGEVPDGKVGRKTLARLDALLPGPGADLPSLPKGGPDDPDTQVAKMITAVLRDPHADKVAFWFRTFFVDGPGLREVAKLVDDERIGVVYDDSVSEYARGLYQADNERFGGSRFVFPRTTAAGWKQRSYILHEGIHALQDHRGVAADTPVSEAAAYIGQCMYYRLATTTALSVTGPGAAIFAAADPIAQLLLAREAVPQPLVETLYAAINVIYAGVPNPDYDGIPG
jgi:hypothetical protein